MEAEEKVLYSRRYPSAQEAIEKLLTAGPIYVSEKSAEQSWQKLMTSMEDSNYELIPGRTEMGQEFIALAIELSEAYEIDADIRKYEHFYEVEFYMYASYYFDGCAKMLAKLLGMCDRFCTSTLKTGPADFTLSLQLMTHKHCQDCTPQPMEEEC